jgi:hypothetical protein
MGLFCPLPQILNYIDLTTQIVKNNTSCIRMPTGIDDLNSQDYVTILGIYIPS